MEALIVNCTLEPSPETSNTAAQNLVAVAKVPAARSLATPVSG